MSNRLFAYGTLRQADPPSEIAGAVRRFRPLGRGVVQGRLYDLGEYPGAILGGADATPIEGTVYELPDPSLWSELDAYEGFDAMRPADSLFLRTLERVRMAGDGTELPCWVYVYNGPVGDGQRILRFGGEA